ncbi:hypothetical protein BGY98DRAFT_8915 [Russula aff. rugulosa BPL654]|nr:hypothetical protein BGY98DRAFT_8915 [Russula aff. rugulosa BPL654]
MIRVRSPRLPAGRVAHHLHLHSTIRSCMIIIRGPRDHITSRCGEMITVVEWLVTNARILRVDLALKRVPLSFRACAFIVHSRNPRRFGLKEKEKSFFDRSLDLLAPGSDGVLVLPVVIVIVDNRTTVTPSHPSHHCIILNGLNLDGRTSTPRPWPRDGIQAPLFRALNVLLTQEFNLSLAKLAWLRSGLLSGLLSKADAARTLETEKPEISLFIRHNDYPGRSECLARSGEEREEHRWTLSLYCMMCRVAL